LIPDPDMKKFERKVFTYPAIKERIVNNESLPLEEIHID
jgi:hypothetical protein